MHNRKSVISLKKTLLSYRINDLEQRKLLCAFSRRMFNYDLRAVSNTADQGKILKARKKVCKSLKISLKDCVFLEQVHKAKIVRASFADRGRGIFDLKNSIPGCDGAMTDQPNVALCLLTADCLPIVLFEPQKSVIGIAHAGWRGTSARIVQKLIEEMCRQLFCSAPSIKVYIGPGIRSCCYKITEDLGRKFTDFIVRKKTDIYLDLAKANIDQLIKTGIKKQNIFDALLCTSCEHDKFYSYRCGDKFERMLTIVMIKSSVKQQKN